jgi:sugar (pentulose or hexulose) kinase
MNEPLFLGIDAGTTSLKAALFDLTGRCLAVDRQEYSLLTPRPAWVELNAEVYWRACCDAVQGVLRQRLQAAQNVKALAISSQAETLIPVDREGNPTRCAIVWLDNRAVEEAERINGQFDPAQFYEITGQPDVTPTWPACKILWIQRNEPEVFARTAYFLLLEDYLLYRLTGQYVTESALQSSSLLLNIHNKSWHSPLLAAAGIRPDQLPCLLEPGELIGPLCAAGAVATGLSPHTLAVSGAIDQAAGALGAGNIASGIVSEMTGGALAIVATTARPRFDPLRRIPCHIHAVKDTYCLLPWGQTAGMALKWFRDQFYWRESLDAHDASMDIYDHMTAQAANIPAGSNGLIVLPHLEGAACPEFDPGAKAVFYGLTLRHTRSHFTRAIMESVAYMLKKNLDLVESLDVPVNEIRSTGGAARSPLWLQIKADVLQKPVTSAESEETACLGAALMAATATGAFSSLEEGVSRMVRLRPTIYPQTQHQAVYQQGYASYKQLYDCLAPMFHSKV